MNYGEAGHEKSNRSIVDQSNLHHGLEHAVFDPVLRVPGLHFAVKVIIQPLGFLSIHGTMEVWLISLFS